MCGTSTDAIRACISQYPVHVFQGKIHQVPSRYVVLWGIGNNTHSTISDVIPEKAPGSIDVNALLTKDL